MIMLIIARGIQGVGGGGIIGLVYIIIADIAAPRDRGKYQGMIGGCFAIASVVGPLIGGALTDHASWRWVFYINLPIGISAIAVIWYGLRALGQPMVKKPKIDYAGTILIIGAVICILLAVEWGGTTYVISDNLSDY
jgi:MFS family permease